MEQSTLPSREILVLNECKKKKKILKNFFLCLKIHRKKKEIEEAFKIITKGKLSIVSQDCSLYVGT